ncbi:Na+/H+ antiporter subunit E [Geobacillus stearothermophilus]|uniref:Na+/H+ antiporter subunit E n=1 Tax=Geobacillus stearothermophilus TaxID=1422 RepID=UPI000BB1162F|nr:Na+/H+ antiporter subunit E [Geobacillus stearothermophilus]ATA61273.1 monovalent cation/H+ antiporter subunit E [Geobacillus stearothermophilus]MDF9296981.1 Na+/H+ antiporter subunit E [Geobacillus stearothermophilus]
MAQQLLINVILAFVWMFLADSFSGSSFVIGYLLGFGILFVLRRYFSTTFYVVPLFVIGKLTLIFIKELLLANWAVLKIVLSPSLNMKPCIFALPLEVKKDWEITLLSNLITLTPGTFVIDVSDDKKEIYIHTIDAPDVDEVIRQIKTSFEKTILEVSR